jgi:hypothetical protein
MTRTLAPDHWGVVFDSSNEAGPAAGERRRRPLSTRESGSLMPDPQATRVGVVASLDSQHRIVIYKLARDGLTTLQIYRSNGPDPIAAITLDPARARALASLLWLRPEP